MNAVAAELAQRGHETTIVCRSREETPHPDVRFEILHERALGSAGRMVAFARAVERHVQKTPYDCVVGLGKTYTHDVIRLGGGCHATYLEKAHEYTLTRWEKILRTDRRKHRLALDIEARALSPGNYRLVIVNSEMVLRDVQQRYGVPLQRIAKIQNGVDVERFHPTLRSTAGASLRRELGLPEESPVVGFLGTGYGRKGLDRLLEAFPAFLGKRPDAHLIVAGRDANPGHFEGLARRHGIEGSVHFLGSTDSPEHVLAACDLYVLPTRYDTFALTILEALACGVPVITTTGAGGSEVVDSGVHGRVVDEGADAGELGEAMAEWADQERIEAARLACRARAEQHPKERTARETAHVLEGLTLSRQPT